MRTFILLSMSLLAAPATAGTFSFVSTCLLFNYSSSPVEPVIIECERRGTATFACDEDSVEFTFPTPNSVDGKCMVDRIEGKEGTEYWLRTQDPFDSTTEVGFWILDVTDVVIAGIFHATDPATFADGVITIVGKLVPLPGATTIFSSKGTFDGDDGSVDIADWAEYASAKITLTVEIAQDPNSMKPIDSLDDFFSQSRGDNLTTITITGTSNVPEPASLLLLLSGAALLMRRRRVGG